MRRDDWNDFAIAVLVVVAVLLLADCIWLHVRSARQAAEIEDLAICQRGMAERQARTAKLALELEKWVETSSVEGRFRQVDAEFRTLVDKVRAVTDFARTGLEAAQSGLAR